MKIHKTNKLTCNGGENNEEKLRSQAWPDHCQGTTCFLIQKEQKLLVSL